MGLLQSAIETYDCHRDLLGVYREGHAPLAPVAHMITSANLELCLDLQGNFLSARAIEKTEPKVIIPVTEESAGRTSSPSAHPLCDQLQYLASNSAKHHSLYLKALEDWAESEYAHPKLLPVLEYIRKGSILNDLQHERVIQLKENGAPENEKLLVVWRIVGCGGEEACWKDRSLFEAYTLYYASKHKENEKSLCMISGQAAIPATQHPKGVFSLNGNAKLISANDNDGFTYRGRFTEPSQAASVSYEASQKAHNALRWLIAEQAVVYGGRAFLCWSPQGKHLPRPAAAFLVGAQDECIMPSDYHDELKKRLMSVRTQNLIAETDKAVIAAFDAATTGRLAVTYYSEMPAIDFLQRLTDWDARCCWVNGPYGVQAPSLPEIVNYAFGTQRGNDKAARMETDDRLFRQYLERLLACKLNGQRIPIDVVRALVQRASMPQALELGLRRRLLYVTCAVLRKYRFDQFGEEWFMALDKENTHRSYLFGRLLAIAEKVEQDSYDKGETRLTNALKLQSVFSRRPLYAWRLIEEALNPYYQRLSPGSRQYYKSMIGGICDLLGTNMNELDKPLEDVYLMGYYNQRQALYTKREEKDVQ